jgi:hypothetical protein
VQDVESEYKTGEKGESGSQNLLIGNCFGVECSIMKFARLIPDVNDSSNFALHSSASPNGQRDALDIPLQRLPGKTGQGTERNENKTARCRLLPVQIKPVLRQITRFPRKTAAKSGLAYNFNY